MSRSETDSRTGLASRLGKVKIGEEEGEGENKEEKEEKEEEKVKGREEKEGGSKEERIRELKALKEENREKNKVFFILVKNYK